MSSSNLIAGVEAWLAEREAIEAAATYGPWLATGQSTNGPYCKVRGTRLGRKWEIANCPFIRTDEGDFFVEQAAGDAAFIADARTVVPGTIAYGKQLVEALRKAEAEYNRHICKYGQGGVAYTIFRDHADTLRAQLAAFAEAHQITAAQQEGQV